MTFGFNWVLQCALQTDSHCGGRESRQGSSAFFPLPISSPISPPKQHAFISPPPSILTFHMPPGCSFLTQYHLLKKQKAKPHFMSLPLLFLICVQFIFIKDEGGAYSVYRRHTFCQMPQTELLRSSECALGVQKIKDLPRQGKNLATQDAWASVGRNNC